MLKIIKYSIALITFTIISSLFVLYFYLIKGINLKNIKFNHINIGELYIKIDKKIIFRSNNIYITTKTSTNEDNSKINFKENTKLLRKTLQYLSFFQEINIQNLNINNNKINLLSLNDNKFTFDNKDIFMNLSLIHKKGKFLFYFDKLNIKQENITLNKIDGEFHSDLLNLYLIINTKYKNTNVTANIKVSNKHIKYDILAQNITKQTISKFKSYLNDIDKLSIKKLSIKGNEKTLNAKFYNLKTSIKDTLISIPNGIINFEIKKQLANLFIKKIDIKQNNININVYNSRLNYSKKEIKLNIQQTNLTNDLIQSNFNNSSITLKNNILSVSVPLIKVLSNKLELKILSNKNKLYFDTTKSKIISTNQNVIVNYKTMKSLKLNNINSTFDINKSILKSSIPTAKLPHILVNNCNIYFKNNKLNVSFKTNTLLSKELNKLLSIFDIKIPIYQKTGINKINGKISYNFNNDKIDTKLKIKVDKSKLMLDKTTYLDIKHSNITLINDKIMLKNTDLEFNQSIIHLNYFIKNGIIDLSKFNIKTYGKFNILHLDKIITIKNYPEDLYIDLNGIDIILKNLKTSIFLHKNISVKIDKLSKFYPYIPYLSEYNLNEGNIKVNINKNIDIITHITDTNQTIISQHSKLLTKFEINTTIDNNITNIENKNFKIKIIDENNISKIDAIYKNLDFNITQFVDKNKTEDNSSSPIINAKVSAQNTFIYYKNTKLYSEKLNVNYTPKQTSISSLYKDRNITILEKNGNIKIYGLRIKEKTFKELSNSNALKDPLITFFAIQNKDTKILQGFIDIQRGYIKELKAFTNVLAFINLIPSLITFQPVGFSDKGYKITYGKINFILHKNILYLKKINIKGENLTFDGQGYIDLKQDIINLNVNVNIIIKLIKDIPIVNYILLGNDGGITIKIKVHGNLKDPQVDKNTASNIIEAPIGIIKRTLLTPFRPFMKDNEE